MPKHEPRTLPLHASRACDIQNTTTSAKHFRLTFCFRIIYITQAHYEVLPIPVCKSVRSICFMLFIGTLPRFWSLPVSWPWFRITCPLHWFLKSSLQPHFCLNQIRCLTAAILFRKKKSRKQICLVAEFCSYRYVPRRSRSTRRTGTRNIRSSTADLLSWCSAGRPKQSRTRNSRSASCASACLLLLCTRPQRWSEGKRWQMWRVKKSDAWIHLSLNRS